MNQPPGTNPPSNDRQAPLDQSGGAPSATSRPSGRLVEAAQIATRFPLGTQVPRIDPLGRGLINDTFLVSAGEHRWVLQRVNALVFPHPERIMRNLALLTEHLKRGPRQDLRIPSLIATADGANFVRGADDGLWRLMEHIDGARVLDRITDPGQAREVGRTLGAFHRLVSDLSPSRMAVTLPGFHVTPGYLDCFSRVLEREGAIREAPRIRTITEFVSARRDSAGVLDAALRGQQIPRRVIHGDPKLDNILFDRDGRRALGLIDLDTVQPGLIHYDIGDCLRSCCKHRERPAGTGPRMSFDLTLCRTILGAFADAIDGLLTPGEVALLYDAVRLIPFELGLRFVTDHLEGDRYFRVATPGENLSKARDQFALVEDIESKEREIRAIIADSFRAWAT